MALNKFNIDRDGTKFVRLWQTAECVADVAKAMDMGYHAVRQTAVRMRLKGVKLKLYKNKYPDYKKLTRIVDGGKRGQV